MSGSRPGLARLAIILGCSTAMVPIAVDMYLPALPQLEGEMRASPAAVQQTLSVFFFGMALAQFLLGPLSDRFGRKRPLLAGGALYLLASVGCALASDVTSLVALRFLQALGGAAGMVIGRAVARDYFEGNALARMMSLVMLVMGLAPILAPLAGSAILLVGGWRTIFWTLASFGAGVLLLVAFALDESLPPERRATQGFGASIAGFAGIAADRRFLAPALAMALGSGAMFSYIAASPFVFISHYGVSPRTFAWIFGGNAVGLIVASQVNVLLLKRWPSAAFLKATMIFQLCAALLLLIAAATGFGGIWGVIPPLFCAVICIGLIGPNGGALAMSPFGARAGSASALMGTLHGLGGATSSGLVGHMPGQGAVPMAVMIVVLVSLGLASLLLLRAKNEAIGLRF